MRFAEHLLEQAEHLAIREKTRPRQASLRRAVSTSYYALYHLLIHDATINWKRPAQRPLLARVFEHGRMKTACDKKRAELHAYLRTAAAAASLNIAQYLLTVMDGFIELQQRLHTTGYDNSVRWARTQVLGQISIATDAFRSRKAIRTEDLAQDFPIYLLVKDR